MANTEHEAAVSLGELRRLLLTRAAPADKSLNKQSLLSKKSFQKFASEILDNIFEHLQEAAGLRCSRLGMTSGAQLPDLIDQDALYLRFLFFSSPFVFVLPASISKYLCHGFCRADRLICDSAQEIPFTSELELRASIQSILTSFNAPFRYRLELDRVTREPGDVREMMCVGYHVRMEAETVWIYCLFGKEVYRRLLHYLSSGADSSLGAPSWWARAEIELTACFEADARSLYPVVDYRAKRRIGFADKYWHRRVLFRSGDASPLLFASRIVESPSTDRLILQVESEANLKENGRTKGGKMEQQKLCRETVLEASIEIPGVKLTLQELADLSPGTLLELELTSADTLELCFNKETVGYGALVSEGEKLFFQISEIKI